MPDSRIDPGLCGFFFVMGLLSMGCGVLLACVPKLRGIREYVLIGVVVLLCLGGVFAAIVFGAGMMSGGVEKSTVNLVLAIFNCIGNPASIIALVWMIVAERKKGRSEAHN